MNDFSGLRLWFQLHPDVQQMVVEPTSARFLLVGGLSGAVSYQEPHVLRQLQRLSQGPVALGDWLAGDTKKDQKQDEPRRVLNELAKGRPMEKILRK